MTRQAVCFQHPERAQSTLVSKPRVSVRTAPMTPHSPVAANSSFLSLVEFLKLGVGQGHSVSEAAKLASRERFRAVLLTSLTAIAGLLPLPSERSLHAQVLILLATSIVFGVLTATALILLAIPALFSVLDDVGLISVSAGAADRSRDHRPRCKQ